VRLSPYAVTARFEIHVEEYPNVGWVGLILYRFDVVDGTDPSDDWRIAALDAVEIVEQRIFDEPWLADQNVKAEIRKEEKWQRDLVQLDESFKRLGIPDDERRERLADIAARHVWLG
jgi:hypothetical protein